jgi:ADP-heptose:LPS heptosyltransferase
MVAPLRENGGRCAKRAGDGTVSRVNIAVVVTGGLSETLQSTPLLRTLRAGLPQARITLFGPQTATPIIEGIPAIDAFQTSAALDHRPGADTVIPTALALRRLRLDAAVLCTTDAAVRDAAYASGIPRRIGPSGGATAALLSDHVSAPTGENRAATWLRCAALLDIRHQLHTPAYEPGPEARRMADQLVHGSGFADGRLLVALTPGTGFAEADGVPVAMLGWDPERYAYLANQLATRHGAGIVLLGAASDRAAVDRTRLDLGASATDLSGEVDLRIIAGVLACCDLLVGGDSPLLHLAAAVGTPAVGLFGPTDGRIRGPYGRDHRVIQALRPRLSNGALPLDWSPMEQIRVEDVLAGIEASL